MNAQRPPDPESPRRSVVTYSLGAPVASDGHEASTRTELARRLASIVGFAYDGEYNPSRRYAIAPYFVPRDTLTREAASRIGIRADSDLFGAVVPHPFVSTKTITHPLLDVPSHAPEGWCAEFPRRVAGVVLEGFSAFAAKDALQAGRRLLDRGTVRVKPGTGIAGLGQYTVDNAADLARALEAVETEEMARSGVVVEQNLTDVVTYSIGQVRVADIVATYYGTQCLTTNNRGAEVYGGSEITVVRGDFEALRRLRLPEDITVAIAQARAYDNAADECFNGFYASRRNYDVARGRDATGRDRSGVLEQSWRLGGASGAEIAALEAFRANPSLRTVHATVREVYGEAPVLPCGAAVYFSGVDPNVGPFTKYAWTEAHADAR